MSQSPRQIVKETIYNHRPANEEAVPEFSFLMDTEDNRKPEE